MGKKSRKYDFQPGQKVYSAQVDEELNQLIDAHNEQDDTLTDLNTRVAANETNITTNTNNISSLQTGKTDKTGDHLGKWQGLSPTDFSGGSQALALGNLANLTTTAKDNLVNAVNEVNGKVNAIEPDPYFTISYWLTS
jgi:hypothetical protein